MMAEDGSNWIAASGAAVSARDIPRPLAGNSAARCVPPETVCSPAAPGGVPKVQPAVFPRLPPAKPMVGLRFTRLVVLSRAPHHPGEEGAKWLCRCDCGGEITTLGTRLRYGVAKSCGCLARDTTRLRGRPATFWTPERCEELARLWRAGTNTVEMAAHFGVKPGALRQQAKQARCHGYDLPMRHITSRTNATPATKLVPKPRAAAPRQRTASVPRPLVAPVAPSPAETPQDRAMAHLRAGAEPFQVATWTGLPLRVVYNIRGAIAGRY